MMRRPLLLAILLLAALAGASVLLYSVRGQQQPPSREREPAPDPVTDLAVGPECLITSTGIGALRPGTTLGTFKETLAATWPWPDEIRFRPVSQYMVDFSAVAVEMWEETLLYAVVPEGDQEDDAAIVELVATSNPRFRTAEGVGPGTTLREAARIYGPAVLDFNEENESREGVTFTGNNAPPANMWFRPDVPSLQFSGFAGEYDEGTPGSSAHETTRYHPFAYIRVIAISAPVEQR